MELVGPDTGGALWVGCCRGRFTLNPLRWPSLLFGLLVRAFRLLRRPWLGRYSHVFLWHGTTIWEASSIWRRGSIFDYRDLPVIIDAMEVLRPSPPVGGASRPASGRHSGGAGVPACATPRPGGTGFPARRRHSGFGASATCASRAGTARLQPWQVLKALEMAEAMVGRPYDWYQIIRIAAFELGIIHDDRMLPRDGDRPICSEGVAMCYLAAGIDLPGSAGVPLWRFAPDHMDKLRRTRPDLVRLVGRLRWDGDPRRTPRPRREDTKAGSRLRALRVPSWMIGKASAREERP